MLLAAAQVPALPQQAQLQPLPLALLLLLAPQLLLGLLLLLGEQLLPPALLVAMLPAASAPVAPPTLAAYPKALTVDLMKILQARLLVSRS
jgi:hypothetical protein